MTYDDFKKLVADMRHAQRAYFCTRNGDALDASKRLERQVDEALRDNGQKPLFQEDERA